MHEVDIHIRTFAEDLEHIRNQTVVDYGYDASADGDVYAWALRQVFAAAARRAGEFAVNAATQGAIVQYGGLVEQAIALAMSRLEISVTFLPDTQEGAAP